MASLRMEMAKSDFHEATWPPLISQRPLWLGDQSPAGKTILLYAEQGLGDTIQVARYIPMLEALGANVIVEVPAPLVGLISTVSKSATVVAKDSSLPPFYFRCPMMSLPYAFKTTLDTVPASVPYLASQPHKQKEWSARLGIKTKPRIGIVWSGSGRFGGAKTNFRDIPLADFQRLILPDFDYFALQKDIRSADRDLLPHPQIKTFQSLLNDFSDTAALVSEMDLIISIDTSVAHLAGALGKPLWLLLPDPPYMLAVIRREGCPWYPTARVFNQPEPGDWNTVINAVIREQERHFSMAQRA